MDPNATLNIMLDRAADIIEKCDDRCDEVELQDEALELAQAVQNLHEWITKGGFLPSQWEKK